uniref:Uncharacterized protein AlNc14C7G990 n=1 Tax=Albugo laibachii Nc14 TaxID=890382 RepID=F0W1R0_9STRA|nr:conserved hypothetical protein [Albugo laibachii Nc14]|eukprot:CCA14989.1 conserved hypothetical protein [Albugo laibachii Nc14]
MSDIGTNRLRRRSFVESSEEDEIITVSSTFSTVSTIGSDDHVNGSHSNPGVVHTIFHGALFESTRNNKSNRQNAFNVLYPIPIAKRLSQRAWTKTSDWIRRMYRSYQLGCRIMLRNAICSILSTLISCSITLFAFTRRYVNTAFHAISRRRSRSDHKGNEYRIFHLSSYTYESQWLQLAALFLLCFQAVCLLFHVENFHLHVEDCQYQVEMISGVAAPSISRRDQWTIPSPQSLTDAAKTMINRMPSTEASLTNTIPASRVSSSQTTSIRYLQQRFEVPYDHPDPPQPSTCIALKPQAELFGPANDIAYLLPRSRLTISKSELSDRQIYWHGEAFKSKHSGLLISQEPLQSRFEWTFQSHPTEFSRDDNAQHVYATYIPLHSFHLDMFPTYFPDIIFVKSVAALKKMQSFRDLERKKYTQLPRESINGIPESKYAQSRSQFSIYYLPLAGSVSDIYDRSIDKNWDAFLHVVVTRSNEEQQWTRHILTLWIDHPVWPRLVLRVTDLQMVDLDKRDALCASYAKLLEGREVSNIDIDCSVDASHFSGLRQLRNEIGFHLFPSPLDASDTEEDMVMQSAAAGAIPIVFDSVVMGEYIPSGCGIRIGKIDSEDPMSDGMRFPSVQVDPQSVLEGIEVAQRLSPSHRVRMGRASRTQYLKMRTELLTAVAAIDTGICDSNVRLTPDRGSEKRIHRQVDLNRLEAFLY